MSMTDYETAYRQREGYFGEEEDPMLFVARKPQRAPVG